MSDASQLRLLDDQALLDLVLKGRETRRGVEWERAIEAWKILAARHLDRIRGFVVSFQFPNTGVRISRDDYDDAAQECYIRVASMVKNFRGTTLGEFFNALRTCVQNACKDFCQRTYRYERGIEGHLEDEGLESDERTSGRFDAALAEEARRRGESGSKSRDELAALAKCIKELPNPDMQAVVRKTMAGMKSAEIADELGTSTANVDALRSRGIKKLKECMGNE